MIDKRYYEKLGGFAYLLGELRKKLGREQTDVLVNDAVHSATNCAANIRAFPKRKSCIPNG